MNSQTETLCIILPKVALIRKNELRRLRLRSIKVLCSFRKKCKGNFFLFFFDCIDYRTLLYSPELFPGIFPRKWRFQCFKRHFLASKSNISEIAFNWSLNKPATASRYLLWHGCSKQRGWRCYTYPELTFLLFKVEQGNFSLQ